MKLGAEGEESALKFLLAKGFKLVRRNFRFQRAEVDIIVEDVNKKLLVFVEVKTRKSSKFGGPEEAITQKKIEQICKSAEGFLMKNTGYENYTKRFDVIAIILEGAKLKIKHYENAF